MTFDAESLPKQLPYYLTADPDKKLLVQEIKALTDGARRGYVVPKNIDRFATDMIQGDGWRGFQFFSFSEGNKKNTQGIVLSNSCDISLENERALPSKVTFAILIKLSKLQERFENKGISADQITSKISAIRAQTVSNLFYIPADGHLDEEYVALLDDLHSMPLNLIKEPSEKLFTLTMAGFYLFIFKLSVHFCRMHENINRSLSR